MSNLDRILSGIAYGFGGGIGVALAASVAVQGYFIITSFLP